MQSETLGVRFRGHRLAYRLSGPPAGAAGAPGLVVIGQYWRPEDRVPVRLLADRWRVFHVTPVGYGRSDRVPGLAGEALAEQVTTVLDHHEVDRFVIWGYSAGGAMAACVARAAPRAAGLVCGGFSLFDRFTPGTMRRLDRRLVDDHASRSLWSWVHGLDWRSEVEALSSPALFYWGSEDRQMARKLRRSQSDLFLQQHADFVELAGLDHAACGAADVLADRVVPMIERWIGDRIGAVW